MIYSIKLISGLWLLGTREDVKRIIQATQEGMKLVRVQNALINPASVSSITRSWEARTEDLEGNDLELAKLVGDETKKLN